MCFWINEQTGQISQLFDSVAAAQAAWGAWQVGHPLHQAGWVLDDGGCEEWKAAVRRLAHGSSLKSPQPYWMSDRVLKGNGLPTLPCAHPALPMV